MQLSLSHLGYLPLSPKILTLIPAAGDALPEQIAFYLRQNCLRMERDRADERGFSTRFPSPYDLLRGKLTLRDTSSPPLYTGMLEKRLTRWGHFWQADFTAFTAPGSYQIETDLQISPPFAIRERIYDRIIAGYLTFLRSQRCGCAVFGVHDACHLDDGVLDRDGSPWPVTGGWHDAGDFRKWLAFTLHHLDALSTLRETVGEDLQRGGIPAHSVFDEISWGNQFFHGMMAPDGQVYEDVAGGRAPSVTSLSYEHDWWFENHPGCYADASDNRWTDNMPMSGDERMVRSTYNPLVQWTFVQVQARVSRHLPEAQSARCLQVARRAAEYARRRRHDERTLFVSAELRGHLELLAAGDTSGDHSAVPSLTQKLLERQARIEHGLSGYFMEADDAEGYRSIAFAADPALTLLRLWELRSFIHEAALAESARSAVTAYIEQYLLADSQSNPFSITPYGVYLALDRERQSFRDAGAGRAVRTFLHPYNQQGIVHGTSSVLMAHAHLMAKGASLFGRPDWRDAAERLLHWCLGHNPLNRSLFSGIGYRQPVGYSFRIPQIPEAMFTGFIGRPDDTPYLEESTAIEWNTLEYWSIPFIHAAQAACWLRR
jgi:Glycosyl hydrolase family 9